MALSLRRLLAVAFALSGCSDMVSAADIVRWTGHAYDLDSGEPIYTERHEEVLEGSRSVRGRVDYIAADGGLIAEKTLDFRSPFSPSFNLEDTRIGYREGLKREGGELVTYKQEPGSRQLEASTVKAAGEPVADAGFDNYIRKHLPSLAAGQRQVFEFVVPSQLKAIRFRVEKVGETERDGLKLLQLVLKPDGFLLRNLVPAIELDYNLADGQLYEYRGISNVRKLNGKGYQARIVFPPDERRVVSAEEAEEAGDCLKAGC